ncbi:hypothetical protein MACH24_11190 [Erythrobacter sp. Dej080120_24]|uniref:hypothetical protein n=1 Tax=Erythrobacter sp. Dej080120_24 TaxID=3024837 RepID=UPI0029244033|nr:hypothetical protein MACH24_11190 [Erythrobacter sp. Dej080120_24]
MTTSVHPARARLLIVYNADGGVLNALRDALWKITSPATYPCSLCAITYGAVSMHPEWKRFLAELPFEVAFHHRDDFAAAYPDHGIALPTIAIALGGDEVRVLVSKDDLDQTQDTLQLMERVEDALAQWRDQPPRLKIVA